MKGGTRNFTVLRISQDILLVQPHFPVICGYTDTLLDIATATVERKTYIEIIFILNDVE